MSETATTVQLCAHFRMSFRPDVLIHAGIKPAEKVKNGYKWYVKDIPHIGEALKEVCDTAMNTRFKVVEPSPKKEKIDKPSKGAKAKKVVEHDPLNDDDDGEL
jgi:hypothetical protein